MTAADSGYAACDMARVDLLAVEFACNGTRMRLNRDERVYAVRVMAGRVRTGDIAARIGTYEREVTRILAASGARICPLCHQYVPVDDEGRWRWHLDFTSGHVSSRHGVLCAAAGRPADRDDPRLCRSWAAISRTRNAS